MMVSIIQVAGTYKNWLIRHRFGRVQVVDATDPMQISQLYAVSGFL